MTAPLSDEQIAEMLDDCENASAASLHAVCRNYVRLLADEVKRQRERIANDEHRIRVNESALMHAKNTNSRERCDLVEARADLAKAVELLQRKDGSFEWHRELAAFLAQQKEKRR